MCLIVKYSFVFGLLYWFFFDFFLKHDFSHFILFLLGFVLFHKIPLDG